MNTSEKIRELKQRKDTVILAHYYVDGAVQEIADFVGDSYALAKKAAEVEQKNILFCGVAFMGESAKLLNPGKHVYMADNTADCRMARMIDADQVRQLREKHPDAAVVCYVNSTADTKAECDVCVTSSNAVKVVKKLKQSKIIFIPDQNLGHVVAKEVPEKEFIYHDGFCPVHQMMEREDLLKVKKAHPKALVLAHPECTQTFLELADYIGSTAGIIRYAKESDAKEFIIATEIGVFHQLKKENPDKEFYAMTSYQVCPNMKKVTLEKVLHILEHMEEHREVELADSLMERAKYPLQQMLELAQ